MSRFKLMRKARAFMNETQKLTEKEIKHFIRLLKDVKNEILQILRAQEPTEWQLWYYPQLKAEVDARIQELQNRLVNEINKSSDKMIELTQENTNKLLVEGGFGVGGITVDPDTIEATKLLSGELIKTVPDYLKGKLANVLSLGLMGNKSVFQVINDIRQQRIFDLTYGQIDRIVRTELMRTQSIIQHKTYQKVAEHLPKTRKIWLWSHKPKGREGHAEAEAYYTANPIPVNEPFSVRPGPGYPYEKLMFPRDPKGSAANVINCACMHTLVMEGTK